MAGPLATSTKLQGPEAPPDFSTSANRDGARDRSAFLDRARLDRVRKREAIRIGVRRPGPAARVARFPLATMAIATEADGKDSRRCPCAHPPNQTVRYPCLHRVSG